MPKRKRLSKRAKGEGSVFERTITRTDGSVYTRWQGAVTTGQNPDGTQRRKTVYGTSQEEVLAKIEETKRALVTGTYTDVKLNVSEYLEQWLSNTSRHLKPRTTADYRYNMEKYVTPKLGRVKLEKLTPLQVQTMLNELADTISPDRANKVRRILYTALKQALKWSLVYRNPVEATETFKHERKAMQLWSAQDTVKFLEFAQTNRLYAMFYLAISAGLRSGELRALRWSDLQGSILHVQRSLARVNGQLILSTPKTEKGKRRVSLNAETLEVLAQHKLKQLTERKNMGTRWADLDLMFCKQDGAYVTPHSLDGIWKRLLTSAGVPKVRVHDLRHLNVSLRRKLGQDAKLIADQVGHTDPAFTVRLYTHLFEEERENASVSLSSLLPLNKAKAAN